MSIWIFRDPGLNAFSRPVTRSSNRAPIASMHVAAVHRQVRLVGAVHAQHAEELRVAGRDRRPAPSACWCTGKPVMRDELRQARAEAAGPELITPPPA